MGERPLDVAICFRQHPKTESYEPTTNSAFVSMRHTKAHWMDRLRQQWSDALLAEADRLVQYREREQRTARDQKRIPRQIRDSIYAGLIDAHREAAQRVATGGHPPSAGRQRFQSLLRAAFYLMKHEAPIRVQEFERRAEDLSLEAESETSLLRQPYLIVKSEVYRHLADVASAQKATFLGIKVGLRFGATVEILEPQELVGEIASDLRGPEAIAESFRLEDATRTGTDSIRGDETPPPSIRAEGNNETTDEPTDKPDVRGRSDKPPVKVEQGALERERPTNQVEAATDRTHQERADSKLESDVASAPAEQEEASTHALPNTLSFGSPDDSEKSVGFSLKQQLVLLLLLGELVLAIGSVPDIGPPTALAGKLEAGIQTFYEGDFPRAAPLLARVLTDEPRSLEARVFSACTSWELGFEDNAIAELQEAALRDPSFATGVLRPCDLSATSLSRSVLFVRLVPLIYAIPSSRSLHRLESVALSKAQAGNVALAALGTACLNDAADYRLLAAAQLTIGFANLGEEMPPRIGNCLASGQEHYVFRRDPDGTTFFFPRDIAERVFQPEGADGA